jgi:hypothetical protein
VLLNSGHHPLVVSLRAATPLPNGPIALHGVVLLWEAVLQEQAREPGRRVQAGESGHHTILVTCGVPWTGLESTECGVTLRRLAQAVTLAHHASLETEGDYEELSVRQLVRALGHRFGAIDYYPSRPMTPEYVFGTRAVGYLSGFDPPNWKIFRSASEWGGAWPHANYTKVGLRDRQTQQLVNGKCGAECQAFVRLAYGALKLLGVDADLQKAVVYAHSASIEATQRGKRPLYTPFDDEPSPSSGWQLDYLDPPKTQLGVGVRRRTADGVVVEPQRLWCKLALIARVAPSAPHVEFEVGGIYSATLGTDEYLPRDRYEAVLRVKADGKLSYYAGGVGLLVPFDEEASIPVQDEELRMRVLYNTYRYLAWVADWPPQSAHPTHVVVAWLSEPYEEIKSLADLRRIRGES